MTLETSNKFIAKLLEVAQAEIGVKDEGNNRGARVEEYKAVVGGSDDELPWCMSLVQFIIKRTEEATGINLGENVKRTEHCLTFWDAMSKYQTQEPEVGRIMIMRHGSTPQGHTGIVEALMVNGQVRTIEGNTGASGGREGDGVYLKSRNLITPKTGLHIIGFIDLKSVPEVNFT